MEETLITLLLSSVGVLAVMALFRWKAHDENLAEHISLANKLSMEIISNMSHELEKPKTPVISYKALNVTNKLADIAISAANRQINYLKTLNKPGARHQVTYENKLKIFGANLNLLKHEKQTLSNLGKATHDIRKFFNRPIFFISLLFISHLVIKAIDLNGYFLHYGLSHHANFQNLITLVSFLGIGFVLLRFYNLFNFSYDTDATHGFERFAWSRWLYDWIFRPGNISRILSRFKLATEK